MITSWWNLETHENDAKLYLGKLKNLKISLASV